MLTPQEEFWAKDFGNEYTLRNDSDNALRNNIVFFSKILEKIKIRNLCEFGCNVGLNLDAIKIISPEVECFGVEINKNASQILSEKKIKFLNESFLNDLNIGKFDLTMTKGVLIHLNPSKLDLAYQKLFHHSNKYILISEYFNDTPITIDYRGQSERLFKRDFAADLLDKYPSLELVEYGFVWKRDKFPQDNETWFLFRKQD